MPTMAESWRNLFNSSSTLHPSIRTAAEKVPELPRIFVANHIFTCYTLAQHNSFIFFIINSFISLKHLQAFPNYSVWDFQVSASISVLWRHVKAGGGQTSCVTLTVPPAPCKRCSLQALVNCSTNSWELKHFSKFPCQPCTKWHSWNSSRNKTMGTFWSIGWEARYLLCKQLLK